MKNQLELFDSLKKHYENLDSCRDYSSCRTKDHWTCEVSRLFKGLKDVFRTRVQTYQEGELIIQRLESLLTFEEQYGADQKIRDLLRLNLASTYYKLHAVLKNKDHKSHKNLEKAFSYIETCKDSNNLQEYHPVPQILLTYFVSTDKNIKLEKDISTKIKRSIKLYELKLKYDFSENIYIDCQRISGFYHEQAKKLNDMDKINKLDKAFYWASTAYRHTRNDTTEKWLKICYGFLREILKEKKDYKNVIKYAKKLLDVSIHKEQKEFPFKQLAFFYACVVEQSKSTTKVELLQYRQESYELSKRYYKEFQDFSVLKKLVLDYFYYAQQLGEGKNTFEIRKKLFSENIALLEQQPQQASNNTAENQKFIVRSWLLNQAQLFSLTARVDPNEAISIGKKILGYYKDNQRMCDEVTDYNLSSLVFSVRHLTLTLTYREGIACKQRAERELRNAQLLFQQAVDLARENNEPRKEAMGQFQQGLLAEKHSESDIGKNSQKLIDSTRLDSTHHMIQHLAKPEETENVDERNIEERYQNDLGQLEKTLNNFIHTATEVHNRQRKPKRTREEKEEGEISEDSNKPPVKKAKQSKFSSSLPVLQFSPASSTPKQPQQQQTTQFLFQP